MATKSIYLLNNTDVKYRDCYHLWGGEIRAEGKNEETAFSIVFSILFHAYKLVFSTEKLFWKILIFKVDIRPVCSVRQYSFWQHVKVFISFFITENLFSLKIRSHAEWRRYFNFVSNFHPINRLTFNFYDSKIPNFKSLLVHLLNSAHYRRNLSEVRGFSVGFAARLNVHVA